MEIKLESGAKLVITPAPFGDALGLQKAIMKAVKGAKVMDGVKSLNLADVDMDAIKDALIDAATSPEVETCLFKCFERSTYNGARVNADLFDDPAKNDAGKEKGLEARKDYYFIAWEVVKANCAPFFERTFSMLKASRVAPAAATPA